MATHHSHPSQITTTARRLVRWPFTPRRRLEPLGTDSLAQVDAYPEPFFLDGSPHRKRLTALADAVTSGRRPGRMTMFCSVGLAGTEVAVAARLLRPA